MAKLRPTFLQGVILVLGGGLFAVFGCLGAIAFLAGSNSTSTLSQVMGFAGGTVFVVGTIAVIVGVVFFAIAIFRAIAGKRDKPTP
jgi:hypothetical protein